MLAYIMHTAPSQCFRVRALVSLLRQPSRQSPLATPSSTDKEEASIERCQERLRENRRLRGCLNRILPSMSHTQGDIIVLGYGNQMLRIVVGIKQSCLGWNRSTKHPPTGDASRTFSLFGLHRDTIRNYLIFCQSLGTSFDSRYGSDWSVTKEKT